ncbi:MAG: hypothetical protein KC656_05965 [Myxococcales bacterium]|nr:hypothetical protein [Myxococcales bacterium]
MPAPTILGAIANVKRRWRIVSLDPEVDLDLQGEFAPDDGVEDSKPPQMAVGSTVGTARPQVQWTAGGVQTLTFSSQIRSRWVGEDIGPKIDALRSVREVNVALGRAPRVAVSWGDTEIHGFADVRGRVVGLWAGSGLPRAYLFEITVTEALPVELDAIASEGETQILRLRDGETFETLGARYLGDPLRGELIRRQNPAVADVGESAGARVKVFEADHPTLQGPVRPTGGAFLDREGRRTTWQPIVELLGASRGSADDPGLPWDLLPGVDEIDTDTGEP